MTPDQLLLTAGVALPAAFALNKLRTRSAFDDAEPILPHMGKRSLAMKIMRPMREPIWIGDAKADFYEMHMGIVAMSGGFKTTLQALMLRQRLQRGRACVVLTGGDSDQLETEVRAHGGWVIRPHSSPLTFNAFEGTPTFMAQGWAGLFPTNSEAKVYHSAFEIACIRYFESTYHYSVHDLKQFVLNYEPPDNTGSKLWKGMKEGYVGIRLELMEMAFGDWIGDQLSILECVRRKIPVMFVADSADDPDLNRFAAALVWQGINYAIRECGGVDVFVDELGRLPEQLVGDHVRTWRRNKSHLIVGTHAEEDFTTIMGDLIHIWALGRMTASATKTRQWASELTWGTVPPENFGAHALEQRTYIDDATHRPRKGYFWVVDMERVQQASVPLYSAPRKVLPRASMKHLAATAKQPHSTRTPAWDKSGGTPRPVPAAAVPSSTQTQKGATAVGTAVRIPPEIQNAEAEAGYMTIICTRQHGPPEMPEIYRPERMRSIWDERVSFPYGALDEKACWHVRLSLKGRGKRPGLEYEGRDWLAYDLVQALTEVLEGKMDAEEAKAFLNYVKLHMKTGDLSVDHLCEVWMGTEAKLCIRKSHLDWEDKLGNSELHWERLRASKQKAQTAA